MNLGFRASLVLALASPAVNAQEVRYEPEVEYVRLLTVSSIELSTQLWLAIRATVEPKKIRDLDAPSIGFEWEDLTAACRIRAIPTTGMDAYKHTSVGYYLEIKDQGTEEAIPKLCAAPVQKLNTWYFSRVLGVDKPQAAEVYVRDFRSIEPGLDVSWNTVLGRELMSAESVISEIVRGQK
jgi:hypothetical protein